MTISLSFVAPGQFIAAVDDLTTAGNGTYVWREGIYASLPGIVKQHEEDGETVIEVTRNDKNIVVPNVGNIVTAKILNVRRRYCKCAIHFIGDHVMKEPFRGMIRKEDVREKEKDSVEMYKCFRTGDVILARVKSIGTGQWYILTTAENELGVVLAKSEAGATMVPVTWTEMMCSKTFSKEPRKVAKVVPENYRLKNEKE